MSAETGSSAAGSSDVFETANDRFKKSFSSWFWGSMVIATAGHYALMAFWPDLQAAELTFTMEELTAVELPPEIEIPPAPEQIARPASPVVTDAVIDENITISTTTFEANPTTSTNLPPPPTQGTVNLADQPVFTPYEVAPELRNAAEVIRVLEREYPAMLRDAGVGGTVVVHFFINEQGIVQNARIDQSSGQTQLDEAALRAALQFRFSPAMNRDAAVPVWVSIPVTFQTN
jgi:protein TonB